MFAQKRLLTIALAVVLINGRVGAEQAQSAASTAEVAAKEPAMNRLVRLSKEDEIWVDAQKKTVIVGGEICLRQGQLEMFACPKGTKEHESVVALNGRASLIHAGLQAIGAKPGKPVQFDPKYVPASGTIIDVYVRWTDEDNKPQRVRAQQWVRQVSTGKPMKHDWVFAGSMFWDDPTTGQRHYLAEGGEAICVSNFSAALLDVSAKSSQANADLLFDALTDNIPPLGTKVQLHLVPRVDKESKTSESG